MSKRIDEPIDKVLGAFIERYEEGLRDQDVADIFCEFLQRLYADALHTPVGPSGADATSLELLDNYYKGLRSDGYCAAVLDVTDSAMGGLAMVLTQLAEIIKTQERRSHIEAVFARHIDPSDWLLRCEIVRTLIERNRAFLPPSFLKYAPWELVDIIPELAMGTVC